MLPSALLLFFLFLLLSAFFSSSETAFIASNPYKLDYLEKKGSRRAALINRMLARIDHLLATILVGNTLVNTAAASLATFIFVTFIPDKNQAILLATVVTTFLILVVSEITPKTYAAYHPVRLALLSVHLVRFFVILFFPLVKVFTFVSRLLFPGREKVEGYSRTLNEEEIRFLLSGIKGMSSERSRMITGVLDIGSRPIKEIMVPRLQIKAIEKRASFKDLLDLVLSAGFSRFPVYSSRMDNIEGIIHAKDLIPYLTGGKEFDIQDILRKPLFIPETAPLEKVLLQMQKTAIHLGCVVDEFGSLEGIVTLEDIIEEIIGEIQDEYDAEAVELITRVDEKVYIVRGNAPLKEVNARIPLNLPERAGYTTLAGFFLNEFGRIPQEGDVLIYRGIRFFVEKMSKRHISCLRIEMGKNSGRGKKGKDEDYCHE